jgi:hypothetical protein
MIRDQALYVSGLLNDSIGGPPVKPYQPAGIWEEATFGKKKYNQGQKGDLYRRTLYTFWRRIVGPTMLFDNASRQVCSVKPVRTNTPLHALVNLNDVTYMEAARVMAEEMMSLPGSPDDKIIFGFRKTTSRYPTREEQQILETRLMKLQEQFGKDKMAAEQLISTGEYPINANLDLVNYAAYTGLSSLLLNLDEVITKQ